MPIIGLTAGMRVVALDRRWGEGGLPRRPFRIRHAGDIDALRARCRFVYVEREQPSDGQHQFKRHVTRMWSTEKSTYDWSCSDDVPLIEWEPVQVDPPAVTAPRAARRSAA